VNAPQRLRVEHLGDRVLGLGVRAPRLSWQLPDGSVRQQAYELEVDGGRQGRLESDQSVLVSWPAEPVGSATRVVWRVRVWTDAGESDWSDPAWFETGLLDASDWRAQWIEPVETELLPAGERPALVLHTTFTLDRDIETARLYATAHGIYETFLNGSRVGDLELTPGFTSYPTNLHVQVYDVTDLLVRGDNEWRVVLSDGWYRGRHGNWQRSENYGSRLTFLGQLHVGDQVVVTGPEWTWATGPIVAADLMDGQVEDRTVGLSEWQPVGIAHHALERLAYSPAPPTRAVETIRPVAVNRLTAERQIVDLGQNINGHVRLEDLGPTGTTVTLVHGEALDADGDVTLDHLGNSDVCVRQTDRVTSAGREGDVFEPRHTVHGFQYVRVTGHPDRLVPDDVTGVVVHTDLRRTGWFRCSDERINRLHAIADWSFRGNANEIPTDCPTRERNGWTGDWQVFFPTAAFLYDVAGFSVKWLRDLAAEQAPNGCVPNIAPDPLRARAGHAEEDPAWSYIQGSSGWGDAIVIVPWELYRVYGDVAAMAELWPNMMRWVDFAAQAARTQRFLGRAEARPDPAPHEQYLWDGGFHFGEWLEPDQWGREFWLIDQGHVGTAYLHHSAALLARMGRLLGHDADAARFDDLAANALVAWRAEYLGDDGSLTPDTQASHVRALVFGLVPEALREKTARRLVELVRAAGTRLGTGFLATPHLLPVLADAGHLDVAYDLLFQDKQPSWLTMVERGATTVWEDWEGIAEDGRATASLNHYSKGGVVSFLHRYVAGIQLLDDAPAYRRVRIEPRPGGSLTWAEATHDCAYGRIESSWRLDGVRFQLVVTIPAGTTGEIVLPDGTRHEQRPGVEAYVCDLGVIAGSSSAASRRQTP
jgi:alpha-L-rhamnosidase